MGKNSNAKDPLWVRRSKLPPERLVGAVVSAVRQLLGQQVEDIEEQSSSEFSLILNGPFDNIQNTLQSAGWRAWRHENDPQVQIDVWMTHPEWPQIAAIHWEGEFGHALDIRSTAGIF